MASEFEFSSEQGQLRDAVRKFSADNFGEAKARIQMESEPRYDRKVWQRLGSDLPLDRLDSTVSEASLSDLMALAPKILKGEIRGRVVVDVNK